MARRANITCTGGALLAALIAVSTSGLASGASSTSTVSVTVASATNIDASSCASGTANVTDMGTMLPSVSSVTTGDCTITFGSSNDSSQLRLAQSDAAGNAMWGHTSGQLDQAFDGPAGTGNGKFSVALGANDWARHAFVQADGKLVTTGYCQNATNDFCLYRLNADGTLDTSFDGPGGAGNGKYSTDILGDNDWGRAGALQPDGKIIVGGDCFTGAQFDFCIARYNTDGTWDTTFDGPSGTGNGKFSLDLSGATDGSWSVALQSDGKIVQAGQCAPAYDFCLARYNADGSLDTTFDGPGGAGNGYFSTAIGASWDEAPIVVIQSDGKILLSGYCANGPDDFCLARYNTDGTWDTAFDGPSGTGNGKFLLPIGAVNDYGRDVALRADGKITVAGNCDVGASSDFCFARLNTDGSLDTTFDGPGGTGNGVFTLDVGGAADAAHSVAVQSNGTTIASGTCTVAAQNDACAVRLLSDGSLDPTFDGPSGAGNGIITWPISAGSDDMWGQAVLPDGRLLVVGGCAGAACFTQFDQVGRFLDYANTSTDWDQGGSMFGTCVRAVAGGATAQWTANAACPATDGAYWNAIPVTATKIAYASSAGTTAATASLRFGVRTATNQPPGAYVAPVTFDVLAPNA